MRAETLGEEGLTLSNVVAPRKDMTSRVMKTAFRRPEAIVRGQIDGDRFPPTIAVPEEEAVAMSPGRTDPSEMRRARTRPPDRAAVPHRRPPLLFQRASVVTGATDNARTQSPPQPR
ncbi:hypothetical protein ACE1SV_37690 [Streptomyces sennicomposti]